MARPFAAAFAFLVLTALPAAASYEGGVAAWGRGDFAAAAREFLPAAEAGDAESQYMLGRIYSIGGGVRQDLVQAWVWHDRAARQGHDGARSAREGLEEVLTPEALALARAQSAPRHSAPAIVLTPPAPAPAQPDQAAERPVIMVPREGPVAAPPTPRPSARTVADGASLEGRLRATGALGEQVRIVQRELNKAGYWAGPVDGRIGPLTRQAIRGWQHDHGQRPTGLLSAELVDRLTAVPPLTIVTVETVPPAEQRADAKP